MQWIRSFWGKHPSFKDYIRINADEPMIYTFVQWVDKGWQSAGAAGFESNPAGTARRFWMVSPNAAHMACGIIAQSADAAGRPAPVLCAMQGTLPKKGRSAWQMLPVCCLGPWQAMADFLKQGFDSFADFKEAFGHICLPDFDARAGCIGKSGMAAIRKAVQTRLAAEKKMFAREKMLRFFFDEAGGMPEINENDAFLSWMTAIGEAVDMGPGSAFLQNAGSRRALYLYYRPLEAADFLNTPGKKTN
ncbi:MAG: hypothetical protein ACOC1H_04940 [Desulfosalsimonas sp.]